MNLGRIRSVHTVEVVSARFPRCKVTTFSIVINKYSRGDSSRLCGFSVSPSACTHRAQRALVALASAVATVLFEGDLHLERDTLRALIRSYLWKEPVQAAFLISCWMTLGNSNCSS